MSKPETENNEGDLVDNSGVAANEGEVGNAENVVNVNDTEVVEQNKAAALSEIPADAKLALNTTVQGILEAFHVAFNIKGITACETRNDAVELLDLRQKLLDEEYRLEHVRQGYQPLRAALASGAPIDKETIRQYIDGLLDTVVIAVGSLVTLLVPFDEGFKRIMEANFTKLDADGKPIYREDGKVLKSDLFVPANIDDMVDDLYERLVKLS